MKKSKFLRVNKDDFYKSLLMLFIAALLTGMIDILKTPGEINMPDVWMTLRIALATAASYLLKNLFTNNEGEFLARDSE